MPSSADVAQLVSDQVTGRLRQLSSQVKTALRVRDADAVHDLRVAIRRFLQTIATFRSWFVAPQVRTIRRQLKNLLSAAGDVRDCDVTIELLRKSEAPDLTEISDAVHSRREVAQRRLAAALRRWVNQKRAATWRAQLASVETPAEYKDRSWDELARLELSRRAKAFFRSGPDIAKKASAGDLHQLRIEAKKLRYTMEMFEPTYPPTVESRIASLHDIQTVLGKINDVRTSRKLVDDVEGGRKLMAALRKKQRKRIAAFSSHWETQFSSSQADEWIQFLRQPVRKPVMRSGRASVASRKTSASAQ